MAKPQSTKAPAFQFYPKDFLSDSNVLAMSLTERGAYWTLCCICWNEGSLPSGVPALARLLGVTRVHLARLWPAIAPCFHERDGRLTHKRLDEERRKQAEHRKVNKANADKRWQSARNATALPPTNPPHTERNALHLQSSSASATASALKEQEHERAFDLDWADFLKAYPSQGRTASRVASELFLKARQSGVPFQDMVDALNNHKASEQWALGKIPNLTKWLEEQRWNVRLDPPKAAGSTSKTAGNAAVLQRFVERHTEGQS